MADWIFQDSARDHDLDARIAASPERWWGTPRYRDRIAVGDRVWIQVTGPHHPGLYYVAITTSKVYEHPGEPGYARWRTDIRFDYRISPPMLRSELLDDATLGSFRPFHGFQGSNVPVPPGIATALSERAAPRLVPLTTVSFAQDIRRLFTDMDIAHMKVGGVLLDDFGYMRDPAHAQKVLDAVSTGAMPPQSSGEPPWPPESVQLFRDWIAAGCQA